MSLFDSSSLVPPIALLALLELESEGFEHLCGVLAICMGCIGLGSLWRIWFVLLIGACTSWVLEILDGCVAFVVCSWGLHFKLWSYPQASGLGGVYWEPPIKLWRSAPTL